MDEYIELAKQILCLDTNDENEIIDKLAKEFGIQGTESWAGLIDRLITFARSQPAEYDGKRGILYGFASEDGTRLLIAEFFDQ